MRVLIFTFALFAVLMTGKNASAAIIDLDIDVAATGFLGTPPVSPFLINFSIVFDNSMGNITNETNGITLNSINVAYDQPIAFSYNAAQDSLWVGGVFFGLLGILGPWNNFSVQIDNISTTPTYNRAGYSQVSPAYNGSTVVGTLTVTSSNTPVPEPGALSLLGAGIVGAAALRRQQRAAKKV